MRPSTPPQLGEQVGDVAAASPVGNHENPCEPGCEVWSLVQVLSGQRDRPDRQVAFEQNKRLRCTPLSYTIRVDRLGLLQGAPFPLPPFAPKPLGDDREKVGTFPSGRDA